MGHPAFRQPTPHHLVRGLPIGFMAGILFALSGCFLLAPQAEPGATAGSSCGADIECEKGLSCECGICATPGSSPVACEVEVENLCGDTPRACFQACGDETEVGQSDCIDGRDQCADGVLRADCPTSTCWGDPAPGEICDDGEYICQFAYIPELDACQTVDCEGEAGRCVMACDGSPANPQVCAADVWQCAAGFPETQCGPCIAPVPACFDDCTTLTVTQAADCDDAAGWTCPVGTSIEDTCCVEAGGTYFGPDDVGTAFDATCLTGVVNIVDTFTEVSLPNLIRADTLNIWDTDAVSISVPNLRDVTGDFSVWNNDVLQSIDVGMLSSVGNLLEFSSNDELDTCVSDAIVTQVLSSGGAAEVVNINNGIGVCVSVLDGGPPLDAGVFDAAGTPDAGADAGALLDAGPPDAANLGDAGPRDAAPLIDAADAG